MLLTHGISPAPRLRLADNRPTNPNANITARNEIRAPRVDVRVPAQELSHGEGIIILRDDVPAGISVLHLVVEVACNLSLAWARCQCGFDVLTCWSQLHRRCIFAFHSIAEDCGETEGCQSQRVAES